jgi:hypothetical protein
MENKLYVTRNHLYTIGLIDLIDYIKTFSETHEMNMIEIGSYAGESTEIFSKNFKSVLSIDPYINNYDPNDLICGFMDLTKVYEIFIDRINKLDNVTHIRKTSDEAFQNIKDKEFDFVYIDGLHTSDQVEKDIENYMKLIKKNGFIGGHDYHPNWSDVISVVNKKFGNPDRLFKDTSWIKRI